MKLIAIFFITLSVVFSLLLFTAVNPPKAEAVPSYARQTGLPCSGCHYTPPELNPAGRRFKLAGYVERADETKVVKADGGKKRAPLDLLSTLPLSAWLETSFTSTKTPVPGTQNGTIELPQESVDRAFRLDRPGYDQCFSRGNGRALSGHGVDIRQVAQESRTQSGGNRSRISADTRSSFE